MCWPARVAGIGLDWVIFVFGRHELDEERMELRCDGRAVELQPKVLALLLFLARHHQRVVSKEEILEAIWPRR